MPERFESVDDYLMKIEELIEADKSVLKLSNQQKFKSEEIKYKLNVLKPVTCKLDLYVPKTYQDILKEGLVLEIYIPIKNSLQETLELYEARGYIRKVSLNKEEPNLIVEFQINIVDPLERNNREVW